MGRAKRKYCAVRDEAVDLDDHEEKYKLSEGLDDTQEEVNEGVDEVKVEKTEIDPDYLASLPAGWSYKTIEVGFGSIIKHFVSPTGREYQSRIEAVRSLTGLAGHEEEADQLRSGLMADGWIRHPLLPGDWLAKPVSRNANPGSVVKFLTESNKLLVGRRKALEHLESSQEQNIFGCKNLEKFLSLLLKTRRTLSHQEDWYQDECLPEGWKYKPARTGDIAKILSPSGELFSSRYKALLHMIHLNYSQEDINRMRRSLAFDGWLESPSLLPADWRYRKSKSGRNEHDFLSPEGEIFKSRKNLVDHFQASNKYTEEDVKNIDLLFEEMKSKWVNANHEWRDGDPSVPSGWKMRDLVVSKGGKSYQRVSLLSPSGLVFKSRVKAAQQLIETNSGEEEVRSMLDCLGHEGWQTSHLLPEKWRVKSSREKSQLFFTSEGSILSQRAAVSHMKSRTEIYSQQEVESLLLLSRDYKEEVERRRTVWSSHWSVPAGWRYRSRLHNNLTREYFLTADEREMAGRTTTIQTLLQQGQQVGDPELQILVSGLPLTGWQEASPLLPPGWWQKEKVAQPGSLKFLSPDCREFSNLTQVFHHLKANGCPSQILNNIKRKLNIKNILSNRKVDKKERRTYKWEQGDFLPPGWKFAEKQLRYSGKKVLYLSDSGIFLKSATVAYQLMKAENVELKYLAIMEDKLREEGWQGNNKLQDHSNTEIFSEDRYLPPHWRMNLNTDNFPEDIDSKDEETEVLILTDEGNILTKREAFELISDRSRSKFCEEHLSSYKIFLANLTDSIENKDWREDEHIPLGWKVKDINLGSKLSRQLRAPSGDIFNSFLSAYIYSINMKDSPDHISKLKNNLAAEGFLEDEKLPEGWLISRRQRGHIFEILSSEGSLFLTLNEAQEYMEEDGGRYNDQNVLELEELCMEEVEIYLKSKSSKVGIKLEAAEYPEEVNSRGVKRKFT